MVIDTHVHVWDTGRLHYPWLQDIPTLNRPYLVEDYLEAATAIPLAGWVFVQCECAFDQARAELDWILSLAARHKGFRGIIPWAPVHDGSDAEPYLAAITAASPLVKGVRRLIQSEADLQFCVEPRFLEGLRILPSFNLSFDICISHTQLEPVIAMVQACPEVQFILDHIGKPDIRIGTLDPWRDRIYELAGHPNVACKISGLVTEADHATWRREDLKPYIDHILTCFGFDRVMFGGDWPVATLAASYREWFDALTWAITGCSEDEQRRLFHDNALRIYRLGSPAT